MRLNSLDLQIIGIGCLGCLACGLIGVFLVLRRMTMMVDAIAHAVLPGVALAFFITHSKSSIVMLIGASLFGLLLAWIVEYCSSFIRLQRDASIGVNYTFFFAVGIILISFFSRKVDLDPDCVIYGELSFAPFDLWITESGINMGPRAFYSLGFVLLINIIFVWLCYKELKLSTFDPAFAQSIGMNVSLWYYLLVGITSLTTVATFDIAGVVLTVSYMVVPASTAYLLTESLKEMIEYTLIIAVFSCFLGYLVATYANSSVSGCIATVSGGIFFIVLLWQRFFDILKRRYF